MIEVGRQPATHTSQSEHEREGIARWQLVAHTHIVGVVLQFNTVVEGERKVRQENRYKMKSIRIS